MTEECAMTTKKTKKTKSRRNSPDAVIETTNNEKKPTNSEKKPLRFLSRREMLDRVKQSYTKVWRLMQKNEFPRSRDVGGKVAWIESEIDDWILSRQVVKLKGEENPRRWLKGEEK
jgi:prophage regulatory protein